MSIIFLNKYAATSIPSTKNVVIDLCDQQWLDSLNVKECVAEKQLQYGHNHELLLIQK